MLITPHQLSQKRGGEGCRACGFQLEMWNLIKEQVGNADYGEIAFQAMGIESFAEKIESYYEDIDAATFEYVEAVKEARELWSSNKNFQAAQKSKETAKGSSKPSVKRPSKARRR